MKICYLINASSIHAERWLDYFAQAGHEVHAVSFESPKQRISNVNYHIIPSNKKLLYLTFPWKLAQFHRIIREIKPDVVDAHYLLKYGIIAAVSGFHPLVVTAMGSDILILPRGNIIWRFVAKYVLGKADLIVCRSTAARELISSLAIPADKVRVIILGVDTDKFHPASKDTGLLTKMGIDRSASVVISTRNLYPVYDLETLIKAVPLVLTEAPETRFIIAGEGEQRACLEALADNLGVLENLKFTGHVPHDDLPRYLSSADIYVSTSLSDGTSNSLLEAMASGLAPVVSDIPANQPWVKDGENGFLFPVKDFRLMAEKILFLIQDKKKIKIFSGTSRKIVEEKAEQKTEMLKLSQAYDELIATGINSEKE